jgi:(S)-2-hydroxyglutarate dehydrogenase
MQYQFVVIGGGIVGLSAAMHVLERYPGRSLLLLEKEAAVAAHQSGHNSGVVHAGVYYAPGSLQARWCREGAAATSAFCAQHGLPFERCGKLLVATDELELQRMGALAERCARNGVPVQVLDGTELRRREPRIVGVGALWVPATAIVDYPAIARVMAARIQAQGAEIRLGQCVCGIEENSEQVTVRTRTDRFQARQVVVCAGLMADRLADLSGLAVDFRIVPFRGEYYRLPQRLAGIIQHLIYPIPDPRLPFLGVHLTRTVGGGVIVGPNAVLSLAREGYTRGAFSSSDTLKMLRFGGFYRLARRHLRTALAEQWSSWWRSAYARLCRKYCPEIGAADLAPYPSGVRAQVVMRDGTLRHDFLLRRTARTLHVCNAPSPAATAAIPIGRHIAGEVCAD